MLSAHEFTLSSKWSSAISRDAWHECHDELQNIDLGHSIHNEIHNLDHLGIAFEDLPVAGIVDNHRLAFDILGHLPCLKVLLTMLRIPARLDLLHCAGNDAHNALQILLALLQIQYPAGAIRLERLARQEPPVPLSWSAKEIDDDWADHLQVDGGSLLPEG